MAKGDSNQLCTILNSSVRRVPPATDPQMGEPRAVSRTKRRLLGAGEEMQPSVGLVLESVKKELEQKISMSAFRVLL